MSRWGRFLGRPAARRSAEAGDVADFRARVESWLEAGSPAALRAAIEQAASLSSPDEVELDVERLQARLEAVELGTRLAAGDWPVVSTQHKAVAGDVCHDIAAVAIVGADRERQATLLITSRRVVLVGTPLLQSPWSAVTSCRLESRDLLLTFKGQTHRIRCATHVAAERASVLAAALRAPRVSASP